MKRGTEPGSANATTTDRDSPPAGETPSAPHALIVQGNTRLRKTLSAIAGREGYRVTVADTISDARLAQTTARADVLLLDLDGSDGGGLGILDDLGVTPGLPVVLIGSRLHADTAVAGLRRGVTDYLTEPVDFGRLRAILADVASDAQRRDEADPTRANRAGEAIRSAGLVGTSAPMQNVYEMIERVAPTSATVIVTGESGTGKELVANAIHKCSRRRAGPFEAINCGAISQQLFESELFGHERGSFTGADRQHNGCVERASKGTLFLDEVAEMPVELQVKLLRILETGLFTRVGGETGIRMNARVIAATNRNVAEAVADGTLREDLYYRLKISQIYLPPLRDRLDDLEPLTAHILDLLNTSEGSRKRFSKDAFALLRSHAWPGNVRELRNVVHSAWIMTRGDVIEATALPDELRSTETGREFDATKLSVLVGMPLAEVERRLILTTLAQHEGNKSKTAKVLGISLKTLYTRLDRYRSAHQETGDTVRGKRRRPAVQG